MDFIKSLEEKLGVPVDMDAAPQFVEWLEILWIIRMEEVKEKLQEVAHQLHLNLDLQKGSLHVVLNVKTHLS